MKRVRITLDEEPRRYRDFRYIPRQHRDLVDCGVAAPALADPVVLQLMNDASLAKRTEREAWGKLAEYLAGQDDRREKPRIRVRIPIDK